MYVMVLAYLFVALVVALVAYTKMSPPNPGPDEQAINALLGVGIGVTWPLVVPFMVGVLPLFELFRRQFQDEE